MVRLAAIFLALVVSTSALDLEMRLKTKHNKLHLKVTVYQSEEEFDWSQIKCRSSNVKQSNQTNMASQYKVEVKPENSASRKSSVQVTRKEAPAKFYYQLIIESNGYVECRYENITSNLEFYRMENQHMYVVKIKQRSKEDFPLAQKLQVLVKSEFRVSEMAPQKNVFHLTSKSYGAMTPENDAKYWKVLKDLLQNVTELTIQDILSTKYCMKLDDDELHLPITTCNTIVVPKLDYVQETLTPFSVRCTGGFYEGVFWDPEDLKNNHVSSRIYDANLTDNKNNITTLNTTFNIQTFCDKLGDLKVTNLSVIGSRFDNLVNSSLLVNMKSSLNTSNELLDYLDKALVNAEKLENGSEVVRPRFAARVQNVSSAKEAAGFAIFETEGSAFANEGFSNFNKNETRTIITEAPSAAVLLPDSLLNAEGEQEKIAVAVFMEGGALFDSKITTSPVISVTIGAKSFDELQEPLKIWFRRDIRKQPNPGVCMSWDFNANDGNGGWSPYGCRMQGTRVLDINDWTVIDECACWHMTHFGEIFWDSDRPFFTSKDTEHESLLNFITFSGCILSLIGLSGIFITAGISPSWLSGPGQKIQLQMSVNLALLIIIFMFLTSDMVLPKHLCSLMGALLHYMMLSNFSWMLLAAYLQYSRLVKVVVKRSSRLLLKSGVIGWGLPLIPVVLAFLSGNFKLYSKPPLCLPSGEGFYLTIFAPLLVIIICNVVVFVLIARSLFQTIEIRRHDVTCLNSTRFKQLVFLFALLGLSWIFAVLQVALPSLRYFFSYFFCFSFGSLGIVYFVFFVLMDNKAKDAWTRPFRNSTLKYDVHRLTRRAGLIYSTRSSSYSSTSSSSRSPIDVCASPTK